MAKKQEVTPLDRLMDTLDQKASEAEAAVRQAKDTAKPKAEQPKHLLPADVLAKCQIHIDAYCASFVGEMQENGKGRVVRFNAVKALHEVWPTATTELIAPFLKDGPFSKVPPEFRRQSTSELSPLLNILNNCDSDKLPNGWADVTNMLLARGWNATVSELRKSGAMPEAQTRERKARTKVGKDGTAAGPAGTNSIALDDPAEAVRLVTIWFERFRVKNLNGAAQVEKAPVLARSFAILCKLASEELPRIESLLALVSEERKGTLLKPGDVFVAE